MTVYDIDIQILQGTTGDDAARALLFQKFGETVLAIRNDTGKK